MRWIGKGFFIGKWETGRELNGDDSTALGAHTGTILGTKSKAWISKIVYKWQKDAF